MAAGSICQSDYLATLMLFYQHSQSVEDAWELCNVHKDEPESVYLSKTSLVKAGSSVRIQPPIPTCPPPSPALQAVGFSEDLEHLAMDRKATDVQEDDPYTLSMAAAMNTYYKFEYHIVYSVSYSVPVLYFNAYKTDGRLLSLEEVWSLVPSHYQERLKHEKWTFITQQEHPILHRPFFQLHPCHTASLMGQVQPQAACRNYLASWLSAVGPVVHLNLPLSYASLTLDKDDT